MVVPGVIGSAVMAAARRAAGLTRSDLARSLGVGPDVVRAWESGRVPLFCVPFTKLRHLARVISPGDVESGAVLNYLLMAARLDLLVSEMLAGSADYAELPAIGAGTMESVVTRELLAWGFHGVVPDCYRDFARPGCLYRRAVRRRVIGMLGELRSGAINELGEYATVLLELVANTPRSRSGTLSLRNGGSVGL